MECVFLMLNGEPKIINLTEKVGLKLNVFLKHAPSVLLLIDNSFEFFRQLRWF